MTIDVLTRQLELYAEGFRDQLDAQKRLNNELVADREALKQQLRELRDL